MTALIDAAAPVPSVARTTVGHQRTRPFSYRFSHRSTSWLVDADSPTSAFPASMRRVLSIRAQDHLGPGADVLGDKLRAYLRASDISWSARRVLALSNARTFGHVFDPITTYFCFDAEHRLEGIVAEVHNTYGEQHCYPMRVEPDGAMHTTKAFYVSPFFAVEGRYDIRARLTPERVSVTISLSQPDEDGHERRVFSGYVSGDLEPATRRRVITAFLRDPFASQRVSGLIRWHGVRLWLRRLPIVPRNPRPTRKGLS